MIGISGIFAVVGGNFLRDFGVDANSWDSFKGSLNRKYFDKNIFNSDIYIMIGAFILVLMLFTTTYAFFNYTRTGTSNTIRVGRIAFNSTQNGRINLTNVFPITSDELDDDVNETNIISKFFSFH